MNKKPYLFLAMELLGFVVGLHASERDHYQQIFAVEADVSQAVMPVAVIAQNYEELELNNCARAELRNKIENWKHQYFEDKKLRDQKKKDLRHRLDQLNNEEATREQKILALKDIIPMIENRSHWKNYQPTAIEKDIDPRKCKRGSRGAEYEYCCCKPSAPSDEIIQGYVFEVTTQAESKISAIDREDQTAIQDLAKKGIIVNQQPIVALPLALQSINREGNTFSISSSDS